jgi:hypothetical protein
MTIMAKSPEGQGFDPIEEGVHTAVCVAIIDLGMQYSELYKKSTRKVMIMWELPDETYQNAEGEEKAQRLSREYSLSLGTKSNLRKDLQAWRGKAFTEEELDGFDLKNVLGKGCQLQIIHAESNGKTYANIASIMGLPKGMKIQEPANLLYFDLEDPNCNDLIEQIPNWIQTKIANAENNKSGNSGFFPVEITEDDPPF